MDSTAHSQMRVLEASYDPWEIRHSPGADMGQILAEAAAEGLACQRAFVALPRAFYVAKVGTCGRVSGDFITEDVGDISRHLSPVHLSAEVSALTPRGPCFGNMRSTFTNRRSATIKSGTCSVRLTEKRSVSSKRKMQRPTVLLVEAGETSSADASARVRSRAGRSWRRQVSA